MQAQTELAIKRLEQVASAIQLGISKPVLAKNLRMKYDTLDEFIRYYGVDYPRVVKPTRLRIDGRLVTARAWAAFKFERPDYFHGKRPPMGSLFDYHPND